MVQLHWLLPFNMYNLSNSIATLRDAETIMASSILSTAAKDSLLRELVASIHENIAPAHAVTVRNAVAGRLPRPAPKQGRETEGVKDEAEVAPGILEAAEGPSEGIKEQAENAPGIPSGSGSPREAQARPAKAKGRKAG